MYYQDFCGPCPSLVCEPSCPTPVLECPQANLTCPPGITLEQANQLKLIGLIRDQTASLQAEVRNQDNQALLRRFDSWSQESDHRWLACQARVQVGKYFDII